jgi:hypothetical protein
MVKAHLLLLSERLKVRGGHVLDEQPHLLAILQRGQAALKRRAPDGAARWPRGAF